MPGILPMKVIKVGTNAQTRIAQACDRCRSKKIRCDGVRPCCSQCANVGFECKTSDKLSRRAFPRGYTESLEERVRSLETEVRELKDLLDEKDEKIDMLSRIHSQSSQPIQLPPSRRQSSIVADLEQSSECEDPDEIFKVQQSPYLLGEGSDSYFTGTSSGRTFIDAFKHRLQERGQSTEDINTDKLLASSLRRLSDASSSNSSIVWKAPPRLLSDQLVNIFFQEWAPLFPVLHRPAFLTVYEKYVANSDSITEKAEVAHLQLVFGIAALSSGTGSSEELESFETQWKSAIDSILNDNTMETLQALLLAQIFCLQQGDLTRLLTYKGLSTTLSARLGLHQTQKRFALGTLTCETRKKVFWSLYTVDCFSSVTLGLPKHIKDEDVFCEYPVDADDEYVTERGFQPTLPGESTKLSSALALFRSSRILSRVLEEVFPAKASYELSLKKLSDLSDELDLWQAALPPHLRLHFAQDKPSTGTISSRSPILSFTYHYIRALIQRPAICASSLGSKSSSSMLAHATSCKHLVQIIQLLEERGLTFSFCLNKDEVLVLSGIGLLFQRIQLEPNSKMLKDNQKSIVAINDLLEKSGKSCGAEFKKTAQTFLSTEESPASPESTHKSRHTRGKPSISCRGSDDETSPEKTPQSSTRKQLKAIASRFSASASTKTPTLGADINGARNALHNISLHPHGVQSQSQPSLSPVMTRNSTAVSRSEPALSPNKMYSRPASTGVRPSAPPATLPPPTNMKATKRQTMPQLTNLDYLSFGNEPEQEQGVETVRRVQPVKTEPQPTDWEKILGNLDNGPANIFDTCYGGGSDVDGMYESPDLGRHGNYSMTAISDASQAWNADFLSLCQATPDASAKASGGSGTSGQAGSIWSFSTDDGIGSADDLTDWASSNSSNNGSESHKAIVLPDLSLTDDFDFGNGWENSLSAGV